MNEIEVLPQGVLDAGPPAPLDERMPRPEVYYDAGRKDYWILNSRRDWIPVNETSLKRQLRLAGFSAKVPEGALVSDLDECIVAIQNQFDVAYAGPLAGYRNGMFEACGQRILVTTSYKLIQPRPGEFFVLRQFMENLLGQEQMPYVLGWLKIAYESLSGGQIRPGQLLVLAGEADCGKSLLQSLITVILGGRMARPYRYMSGETPFNAELFGAEHLVIEDDIASTDIKARRNFGTQIKEFTVNTGRSCHGKGRQAITLYPFWRMSVSVNEEPENLMILPPLDDSLEDKMMLLKVTKAPLPMPTVTDEERKAFWDTIVGELPAFIHHLTCWKIPDELKSSRFGLKHFHHPALVQALDELSNENKLLSIIDAQFAAGLLDASGFIGTAEQLESKLCDHHCAANSYEARKLLYYPRAMGSYLGKLAKNCPDRVICKRTGAVRNWLVLPPEGLPPGRSPNSVDFSNQGSVPGLNPFAKAATSSA